MNWPEILSRLLPSQLVRNPQPAQARKDHIAREIVARNAEGSVRLGMGHYRTAEQIEADFRSVCKASF